MPVTIDQQFVEYIVKSLVGNPDAVKVERTIDEKGVLLALTVAPEDLGRVIGKRGNTAQSIRTLLRALGTKNDARYNLKIVDVNGSFGDRKREPREDRAEESQPEAKAEPAEREDSADAAKGESDGASQWSHLATPADDTATDEPDEDKKAAKTDNADESPSEEEPSTESSSVVEKTRKELEDLADINI